MDFETWRKEIEAEKAKETLEKPELIEQWYILEDRLPEDYEYDYGETESKFPHRVRAKSEESAWATLILKKPRSKYTSFAFHNCKTFIKEGPWLGKITSWYQHTLRWLTVEDFVNWVPEIKI